ncbi:hypothetical protein ACFW96_37685 [Streptomyces gardneri]|uniref:hypothetical protein n=1 Tax=Streptomyces gardneri TaxID=66892 RepID=UPI00369467D7
MTTTQRLIWGGTTLIGILIVGASIRLGLERASMLGGILGSIFGLLAVSVGVYQLTQSRQGAQNPPPRQVQRGGENSINIQSGNDLTIGDSNKFGKP